MTTTAGGGGGGGGKVRNRPVAIVAAGGDAGRCHSHRHSHRHPDGGGSSSSSTTNGTAAAAGRRLQEGQPPDFDGDGHDDDHDDTTTRSTKRRNRRPAWLKFPAAASSSCCSRICSRSHAFVAFLSSLLTWFVVVTSFAANNGGTDNRNNKNLDSMLSYHHAGITNTDNDGGDDDYTRQKLLDQAASFSASASAPRPQKEQRPQQPPQTRIRKSLVSSTVTVSTTTTTKETTSKTNLPSSSSSSSPSMTSLTFAVDGMIESDFGGRLQGRGRGRGDGTERLNNLPVRVWEYDDGEFPCVVARTGTKLMERTPSSEGFLFQRPMKVGSTSFVGVVVRLVHNRMKMKMKTNADEQEQVEEQGGGVATATATAGGKDGRFCSYRAMHGSATRMGFDRRRRRREGGGQSPSFLMSLVRDPTARAVSEFFHFVVSNGRVDPTDRNFQLTLSAPKFRPVASPPYFYNRYLLDMTCRNYHHDDDDNNNGNNNNDNDNDSSSTDDDIDAMSDRLVMERLGITEAQLQEAKSSKPQSQNVEHATIMAERLTIQQFGRRRGGGGGGGGGPANQINYTQIVDDILQDYDYIGVTERMDESLVVLSYLLDLSLEEILYVKNPRASGGWGTHTRERPCVYVTPSFVSPGMYEWFNGGDGGGGSGRVSSSTNSNVIVQPKPWPEMVYGDTLLHRAVNASLDATIDSLIGRTKFDERLRVYLYLKQKATEFCHDRDMIRPACSDGGIKIPHHENTCYIWGEACDHVCLDSDELKQYLSGLSPAVGSADGDNE